MHSDKRDLNKLRLYIFLDQKYKDIVAVFYTTSVLPQTPCFAPLLPEKDHSSGCGWG